MLALRLESWKSEPVLGDVPVPEPGPGEVVVQVGAAGACHSDLHLMHDFEAGALPWGPPFTLGHENAGWVHALGDGVAGVELGQPVAVVGRLGLRHAAGTAWTVSRPTANVRTWRRCPAAAVVWGSTAAWLSTCWCRPPGIWCRCRTASRWSRLPR